MVPYPSAALGHPLWKSGIIAGRSVRLVEQ
jgi:hypothetical protein